MSTPVVYGLVGQAIGVNVFFPGNVHDSYVGQLLHEFPGAVVKRLQVAVAHPVLAV
jgi:hypothetical protein